MLSEKIYFIRHQRTGIWAYMDATLLLPPIRSFCTVGLVIIFPLFLPLPTFLDLPSLAISPELPPRLSSPRKYLPSV